MAKKRANGEGNIRKRKDGRWEGRYTAGYDSKTGKRLIKNVLGKTQAEVKEKLKIALEETNGLDVSKAADVYTVASWLRTWYELYAKPNVRTATANRYELIIETYTIPRIGNIKLKMLTTRHLQKLYKELLESGRIHVGKNQDKGLSSTTVHSVHLMLHCALDRAVKERLISRNPCEDCIVPKPRKLEMKILPPEHMKAYLEAAEARGLLPMFYLELISGLRKGDDDDKIRLNQRKPSKYKGLRRFGPEKNLQRINKFMKERPIFYKNLIQMKENIRFYLRCFYCITKVMILQFNSENRTELARNG